MKNVLATLGAGTLGAGAGYGLAAATGARAVGVLATGAGFGAAAGPVGAIAGAVIGLAVMGVIAACSDDDDEPETTEAYLKRQMKKSEADMKRLMKKHGL